MCIIVLVVVFEEYEEDAMSSPSLSLMRGYATYVSPLEVQEDAISGSRLGNVGTSVSLSVTYSLSWSFSFSWSF